MWKSLTTLGMLGVLAYVLHVMLGGVLWKGYSHLMQPISDLTASGAPDRALLGYILNVYAVCMIIFGISAFMYIRRYNSKVANVGIGMFTIMQLISASYGFFPEDLKGNPLTFLGLMHYVVTAAIVPLTILSPLLVGIGFRKIPQFKVYSMYSILTSIVIFLAGGISVIIAVNSLHYFGLVERINIGTLELWIFVMSFRFFTEKDDIKGYGGA